MNYFIYILTNKNKTTLYIGVTNDLTRRLYEHQNNSSGFVKKYKCENLTYFERFDNIISAIDREKQLKKWSRKKKEVLIERDNPNWNFILLGDI